MTLDHRNSHSRWSSERDLACPGGGALLPVYPPRCGACGASLEVAATVQTGRTRARQSPPGRYPESVRFTREAALRLVMATAPKGEP